MKFLNLKFIPQSADLALLIVRVLAGFTLIYAHGWKKLAHFNDTVAQWTQWGLNPIGVGPTASVALSGWPLCICWRRCSCCLLGQGNSLSMAVAEGVSGVA